MINIQLNFSAKFETLATAETRRAIIEGLLALQKEAKEAGLITSTAIPAPARSPVTSSKVEHGPHEKQWLQQSGNKRMRVPPTWEGTREEFAYAKLHELHSGSGIVNESSSDDNGQDNETETEDDDLYKHVI